VEEYFHVDCTVIHSGMDKNAAFSKVIKVGRDYASLLYFYDNGNNTNIQS